MKQIYRFNSHSKLFDFCFEKYSNRFHAYCINTHIPLYSPSCWDVEQFQQTIRVNKVECGGPPKGWGQHEDCVLIFEELEEARSLLQRIEEVLHDVDRIPDEVLKGMDDIVNDNL